MSDTVTRCAACGQPFRHDEKQARKYCGRACANHARSPRFAAALTEERERHRALAGRIAALRAAGMTREGIGQELGISRQTVRRYLGEA